MSTQTPVYEVRKPIRLDEIVISTWFDDTGRVWCACLDGDEGVFVAHSKTQRGAVNELLDNFEQDNGEICW